MRNRGLDEEAVCEGYRAGKSIRDLAEEFGVSTAPIQRILREHGIQRRTRRGADRSPRMARSTARAPEMFSPDERADVKRRFLAGETQVALAKSFRCGATTIATVLRAEGVPAGTHGQMREHHHSWKGGKRLNGYGYVMIRVDQNDPIGQAMRPQNSYLLEHRLVLAQSLGRPLLSSETVHHINGDITDNRLENLQLRNGRHGKGSAFRCRSCGSTDIEPVDLL